MEERGFLNEYRAHECDMRPLTYSERETMQGNFMMDNVKRVGSGAFYPANDEPVTTLTFSDGDSAVTVYLTEELRKVVHNATRDAG